jgi:hypothetical protein
MRKLILGKERKGLFDWRKNGNGMYEEAW